MVRQLGMSVDARIGFSETGKLLIKEAVAGPERNGEGKQTD